MEEQTNNEVKSTVPAPDTAAPSTTEAITPPTPPEAPEAEGSSNRNMIIGIVLAVLVLGGGYYFMQNDPRGPLQDAQPSVIGNIDSSSEVAKVNGVALYGSDLELQMVQSAQVAGLQDIRTADPQTLDIIRSQSLDAIINTELIVQTAKAAGITVTQADIDLEYETLSAGIGGTEVAEARLAELGTNVEEFKGNLNNDILIRRYIESTIDETALEVSEEEIVNFYAEVTGGQTEGMPTLEEAHSQIEEQLKFQKQQEVLLSLIEELRASAQIEILI